MKFNFIYLVFIIIYLHSTTFSQNLIPNPGFENFIDNHVNKWQQPTPPFYHFTVDPSNAHNGIAYNGLCLWKYSPSEFLSIELAQPLKEGQIYQINLFYKIDENYSFPNKDSINQIGILFTEKAPYCKYKFIANNTPDVILNTTKSLKWIETKGLYIAKGYEQYLQLGYFSTLNQAEHLCQNDSINKQYITIIDSLRILKEKYINNAIDSIKKKYPFSFNDLPKTKRKKEKYLTAFKQSQYLYRKELEIAISEINQWYDKLNQIIESGRQSKYATHSTNCNCQMRFYFDDFQISPVNENQLNCKRWNFDNIYFDNNQSNIKKESYPIIDRIYDIINQYPNALIRIEGHTDNSGSLSHNYQLSADRAKKIKNYLINKGFPSNRISSIGYGPDKPIAPNNNDELKQKNRRVEVLLILAP